MSLMLETEASVAMVDITLRLLEIYVSIERTEAGIVNGITFLKVFQALPKCLRVLMQEYPGKFSLIEFAQDRRKLECSEERSGIIQRIFRICDCFLNAESSLYRPRKC